MKLLLSLFLLLVVSANAANLIPNSSFECGTENWRSYGSQSNERYGNITSTSGRLTSTNSVHGNSSLMWKTRLFVQPKDRVLAGTYQLTYSGMSSSAGMAIINTISSADYVANDTNGSSNPNVTFGTSYARYTNTLVVPSNMFLSLKWYMAGSANSTVWLDAVQLETGTVATAYAPMATVETGLTTTNISHILNVAAPNYIQLKAWNDGSSVGMTSIVQVFDFENTNYMAPTSISTNALATGATTINVALPAKSGWMRAMCYQPQVNGSWNELVFFVRPYDVTTSRDTNGLAGGHPNAGEYGVQRDREAGYTWSRGLSPSQLGRWSNVQPHGSGAFDFTSNFEDAFMNLFITNGTVPMISLNPGCDPDSLVCDGYWPRDATNGAPVQASISAWTNFVGHYVARYSAAPSNVWVYELGNEWHHIVTPTDFNIHSNQARFQAEGAKAIKNVCPQCTCIAVAGQSVASDGWQIWTNMTAPEQALFDVVSAHLYPIGQGGSDNPNSASEDDLSVSRSALAWAQQFAGSGKQLWNTECGNQGSRGGNLGPIAISIPFFPTYYSVVPPAGADYAMGQRKVTTVCREARQALRCWGVGFSKVFSYRTDVLNDTYYGSYGASAMEWNGAPRQGAAAALIAANYFCRFPGLGRVTNNTTLSVEAYRFTNVLGNVIAFWSSDNAPRTLTFTNGNFAVWDVMRNLVQTNNTNVLMGRTPQYLVSGTLTGAQFVANFTNALVAPYSDVTGPNISIDASPVGAVTNGTYFFKWTITDKNKQVWTEGGPGVYTPDETNNLSRIKFFAADTWKYVGQSNYSFTPFTVDRQFNLYVEGKDFYNNTNVVVGPAFGMLEAPAVSGATNVINVNGVANIGTITVVQ